MKQVKFLIIGFLFGIVLTQSEAISWYRIYEMFKFQSFHMYGIIGTAVGISLIFMQLFKKGIVKDYQGQKITVRKKDRRFFRALIGGIFFGFGWALVGACPAPIFVLIGKGFLPFIVVLLGALLGTFVLGLIEKKLP